VGLERGRMDHVSRGFYPAKMPDPLDGLVYVTLQELATRIAHRNTGAITGDPVAERMMSRIAVDENLHYVFYRDVTSAAIEIDASATVMAMHRQITGFAMPGFERPGFREKAIRIASAGIYDLRIHHDQVIMPVLRHWKLTELDGLDAEASRARDEILDFCERIDAAADRFSEKRAS
jgi:acyl-[acyl-carrier-protein] desaturase